MNKRPLLIGSVLCLLTVIIGAFGAHGLATLLEENGRTATFQTAVEYQTLHAIAILIIGMLSNKYPDGYWNMAVNSMLIGVVIFSGSLYFLSITNLTWIARITPVGGLAFIVGWIFVILAIKRYKNPENGIHD